jgi:diguanylate cyclase (GGDEF)-like protein
VLCLDVDRFKTINDASRYSGGDDMLRALATHLELTVPRGSLVARLGGDEFVIARHGSAETGLAIGRAVLTSLA